MAMRQATNGARKIATGGSIFDVINIAQIRLRLRRNIKLIRKSSMHRPPWLPL
jgi:hypothetical protein